MKRRTDYSPERGREYTWTQWQYLHEAFMCSEISTGYKLPSFGVPTGNRRYFICKPTYGALTKAEITALYWFFAGVIASPGFPKESE